MPISNPAGKGRAIHTGSYVGNATAARQIVTGFKCSLVIIESTLSNPADVVAILVPGMTIGCAGTPVINDQLSNASLHATDGFTLSASQSVNKTGDTYYYWAMEE